MRSKISSKFLQLWIGLFALSLCVSCARIDQNIGFGPPEREIEKLYIRADKTYSKLLKGELENSEQNWNWTVLQFQEIVKNYSGSQFADDAQYRIGLCYIQANGILKDSPLKARSAFRKLISNYRNSEFIESAYYWSAYSYYLEEDYRSAIQGYKIFMRKYPDSELYSKAKYQMGHCETDERSEQEKIQDSTERISTPPVVIDHAEIVIKKPGENDGKDEREKAGGGENGKTGKRVNENVKEDLESSDGNSIENPGKSPQTPLQGGETDSELITHHSSLITQQSSDGNSIVEGVRYHSWPEFTRVVVDLSRPVEYETNRLSGPDRIYVDLQTAIIDSYRDTINIDDQIVRSVRSAQFDENTVRIVLDVKQTRKYEIFYLTNPDRLVMDVYGGDRADDLTIFSPSERRESPPLAKQLGLKVRTIVIDPGHGGKDPGAVSESGLLEKDVVLDIAKRLRTLLKNSGDYQIYLTRESDVYIPLRKRTEFANQKKADIFISIHINAGKRKGARGIETYYLSMASDEEAALTAAFENASAEETIKDLNKLVRDILSITKVEESRALAKAVQYQLCQHIGSENRGVKRAPFLVLIGAEAPSILVELEFISNKQDEKLLRSDEHKDKLALALKEGVESYINW